VLLVCTLTIYIQATSKSHVEKGLTVDVSRGKMANKAVNSVVAKPIYMMLELRTMLPIPRNIYSPV